MYKYKFESTINDLLDAEDADMAERTGLRRSLRSIISAFGLSWIIFGFFSFGSRQYSWEPILWILLGSLLLYYFAGRSYISRYRIRRDNLPSMELVLELWDDRIDVEVVRHGAYSRKWSELLDFKNAVKGVTLYFVNGTVNWLPNRIFENKSEKESLIRFLSAQMQNRP